MGLLCMSIDSGNDHRITGRTRLQKTIYFCKYLGWGINDYRLHYYGPFSPTLTNITEMAESNGLVVQTEAPHVFTLTEKGEDLMRKFMENICDLERAKRTQKLVKYLSGWSSKELEVAATIDYVNANSSDMDTDGLLDKVHRIKPNFSQDHIRKAYDKWTGLKSLFKIQ